MNKSNLSDELTERVLARLGFSHRPEPTPESLRALYAAWCLKVPFDNVLKLIHVRTGNQGPFPGGRAEDFFESWLRHGTGSICWGGAGSLHALLQSLDFNAVRGIATMLVAPGVPPNHGTVQVIFEHERYLVDTAIMHGEPLRLEEDQETHVKHPAWHARCRQHEGRYHVAFQPLHKLDGLECRVEFFEADQETFDRFYENTRTWSPFNYQLYARINRPDCATGTAFGQAVTIHQDGSVTSKPIDDAERVRLLIEVIGLSEEIVSQLPADAPTPPPPGSRTALAASGTASN